MRKPAEPKWILLSRQHDGAWTCGNMEPVFKPEANRTEKISRIIFEFGDLSEVELFCRASARAALSLATQGEK